MPRITPEREQAVRDRILKAARQVFVEKGFSRTSVDDVVAACGMSVGAIYNYFPNKDELIRACIDAANRDETNAILADAQAAATLAERVDRAIGGWWKYTIDAPGGAAFLAEAWGEASRRPVIRELMAVRFERAVTTASLLLRQGMASGELPADLEVEPLARTFAAMLDGLVVEYVISGGRLRQADARERIRFVLRAAASEAAWAGSGWALSADAMRGPRARMASRCSAEPQSPGRSPRRPWMRRCLPPRRWAGMPSARSD